jgi:2-dehydropantoate 2-reductase
MKFLILGAGGIGSYFGARLIEAGHDVVFMARGKQLETLQRQPLKLLHPKFYFEKNINVIPNFEEINFNLSAFDVVLIATKSRSTEELSIQLKNCFDNCELNFPYIISLQNGVENEEILSKYLNPFYIIGGLTRKIGSHIISPSIVKSTGNAETILGSIDKNEKTMIFLKNVFNEAKIPTTITNNINLELWKKLVINNGVNAICALVSKKTGEVMQNKKLAKIVYNSMIETAIAAKNKSIHLYKEDVDEMFQLISDFDSIKPSMLVDVENKRPIELNEICDVVIRNCEEQDLDAPYTRIVSTLLDLFYNDKK